MNPDELEKLKKQILQIKATRLILDPFPDHSDYAEYVKAGLKAPRPAEISIWEAYRRGYEKAYREILENLK